MTREEILAQVAQIRNTPTAVPSAGAGQPTVDKNDIMAQVAQIRGPSSAAPADGTAPSEGILESIAKDAASIPQAIGLLRDPTTFARLATTIHTLPQGHPIRVEAEKQLENLGRAAAVGGSTIVGAMTGGVGPALLRPAIQGAAAAGVYSGIRSASSGAPIGDVAKAAATNAAGGAVVGSGLGLLGLGAGALASKLGGAGEGRLASLGQEQLDAAIQEAQRAELQKAHFANLAKAMPDLKNNDEARYMLYSQITGKDISSINDLSNEELHGVNNFLRGVRGAKQASSLPDVKRLDVARNLVAPLAVSKPSQFMGAWYNIAAGGASALRKLGPAGAQLAQGLEQADNAALVKAAPDFHALRESLGALNPKQFDEFVNVAEGADVSSDNAVNQAAQLWDVVRKRIAGEADTANLRTYNPVTKTWDEWKPRDNYFPHSYTEASLEAANPRELQKALGDVVDAGFAQTPDEVRRILTRPAFGRNPELMNKNLQMSRLTDIPGYERTPQVVLNYVLDAQKRIELAKQFGGDNVLANALIDKIGSEGSLQAAKMAQGIFQTSAGEKNWELQGLYRGARNLLVPTMLTPTSTLKHTSSQLTNTMVHTGIWNTLSQIPRLWTPEGKNLVQNSGVLLHDMIPELMSETNQGGSDKLARGWTNLILIRPVMRLQRSLSALAGSAYAQDVAERYATNPTRELTRKIVQIGLDPEAVVAQGGKLTPQQQATAALQAANNTQLMSRPLDLPNAKNTTAGQFIYFLRSSAFQQSATVKNLVFKPMLQFVSSRGQEGDLKPLVRWLTLTGTMGVATGNAIRTLKSWIRGTASHQEANQAVQALTDAVTAGHLGLISEALQSAQEKKFGDFLQGPVVGTGVEAAQDVGLATKGNFAPAGASAVKRIPILGPRLAHLIPSGSQQ